MNLSTLLKPPPAPPETPEAEPSRPRLNVSRQRNQRYRRALAIGVIISVAVHAAIVLLSPLLVRYAERGGVTVPPPTPPRAAPEGMQVVEVMTPEAQPVEPTPEPEPEPEAEPGPVAEAPTEEETEPALSAADRLRPRVGDWRLWIMPPLARNESPTPAERTEELNDRLRGVIEAYEDSMAAAAERRADAMDWTVGEEGNKWGVSPEGLHLGPITLPIPINMGAHPAVMRELRARQAEWNAIQRQAGEAAAREEFEERVKKMREEKEKEDENAKRDTTSSNGA